MSYPWNNNFSVEDMTSWPEKEHMWDTLGQCTAFMMGPDGLCGIIRYPISDIESQIMALYSLGTLSTCIEYHSV